jgi:hypothetical protein
MRLRVRIVPLNDGGTASLREFRNLSYQHSVTEWEADGARLLQEELDEAYRRFAVLVGDAMLPR